MGTRLHPVNNGGREEPIEEPNIGADQDEDQDDRKRTEFEESAFIRTVLSKEEKQKKAKKKQREDDLQVRSLLFSSLILIVFTGFW